MNSGFQSLKAYLEALALNAVTIEEVLACFKLKHYRKNEYFAFAGRVNGRLGFVVDGLFIMLVEKAGGVLFTKDFLHNNHFLLAAFDPQDENLVHIRAAKDSLVLEARYCDIQNLSARFEDFRSLAEKGMQKRYQAICERLERLATLDAAGRYLAFLQEFGALEAEIPQHYIAAYVGVTPTQLSRIRKKLR